MVQGTTMVVDFRVRWEMELQGQMHHRVSEFRG